MNYPDSETCAVPMLLLMFLPFAGTAQVMQFQRFSSNVGLSGGFWTNDNGKHWKEIAWPDGARTVFFLTPITGWVLITQDSGEENPSFALGTTHDSGATWSVTPIRVPVSPKECILPGKGHLQFTDEMHGWVNLMVQSGSAFDFGILLKTVDGGKTWVTGNSPFLDSQDEFLDHRRVKTMPLPARSPNLNAYAERWVRSVKQECLSKLIWFGERPLRRALQQYVAHYHEERNHQGKQNRLLFPLRNRGASGDNGIVRCKERLGGLLKYYEREAA